MELVDNIESTHTPFSVLMSIYIKEHPDFLRQSLDSVFSQTLPPDEVVLVEDGPLTPELYAVIDEFSEAHKELKRVPLEVNYGLGIALSEGLERCSYQLVARMDTDDVAKPRRFEKQVRFMEEHPDIVVCGSWIDEFIGHTDNVVSRRATAVTPEEVAEYTKTRCPMNHPTVMFRKKEILEAGGYRHFPLFEDWNLWICIMRKGYKMANIPEALVWFRITPDVYKRRGGWKYAKDSVAFQMSLHRLGLISGPTAVKNSLIRTTVSLMPNFVRGWIYYKFLRK